MGRQALNKYRVETLEKGLRILQLCENSPKPLRIKDVADLTGIDRGTAFRLLSTLEFHGYIERLRDKRFYATNRRRPFVIGYSAPLSGNDFRLLLSSSIERSAIQRHLELKVFDTADDPELSLRSVRDFIDSNIDLLVVFQPDSMTAYTLADIFSKTHIPVISIQSPIPGTVYFGANNYLAGKLAGEALVTMCNERWHGQFDRIVILESSRHGEYTAARSEGLIDGLSEAYGPLSESRLVRSNCQGAYRHGQKEMSSILQHVPDGARLLISAFNDPSALGALKAIRDAGRETDIALVSQGGTKEIHEAIVTSPTGAVAAIAHFPERYGAKLMELALTILNKKSHPMAVYTDHVVLTQNNLHTYYSCDENNHSMHQDKGKSYPDCTARARNSPCLTTPEC